jgi:hypothetical protein
MHNALCYSSDQDNDKDKGRPDYTIRSSTLSPSNALATLLLARSVRPYFSIRSGASCKAIATQATSVEALAYPKRSY